MASHFRGITVKQFKDTLETLRKVYNFDDEKTRLSDCVDASTGGIGEVEIITTDEETGVSVILAKSVEAENKEKIKDTLWNY